MKIEKARDFLGNSEVNKKSGRYRVANVTDSDCLKAEWRKFKSQPKKMGPDLSLTLRKTSE